MIANNMYKCMSLYLAGLHSLYKLIYLIFLYQSHNQHKCWKITLDQIRSVFDNIRITCNKSQEKLFLIDIFPLIQWFFCLKLSFLCIYTISSQMAVIVHLYQKAFMSEWHNFHLKYNAALYIFLQTFIYIDKF